ncbi:conserved hypothetical protein [Segniliparus rotundus DSM 44985]|uniref:Uncharacterized protein n=1 Tax=Segniliparus rotundus (strain ATCC BAA-972 / CDC 1076 / CIP 108378 / DSM 44985 / JCM 13578) TaxID=640132 RepID=D6ZFB7_SEGRD|nr:conserved hypothetical protein [Segniliparus rotundus DSM 44985]
MPRHGVTLRLRLKPKAEPTGHVDGAWWPRSRDLAEELPELLRVLGVRLGHVHRVIYRAREWAIAPAQALIAGKRVLLDKSYYQPPGTIRLEGERGRRHTLFVVPPWGVPHLAHDAMMTAAAPNDKTTVADLLEISDATPADLVEQREEEDRWGTDGGALPQPSQRR